MSQHPAGALDQITVLDMTRILAGPWATQTLADLGANVVKIERPGSGDDTRSWGPPYSGSDPTDASQNSAYFCTANRNKKSLALDFASEQGAELVRQLATSADVFIENYKVGGLQKYGLDYDALKQHNPRLIYCSITGFGQTGPYANRSGYDFIIQAMSGLMSVTGQAPGTPGDEPMKIGVALTDILTGLYSCIGILSAIAHREKTGLGQRIDMSLLDVSVACMANQALNYLVSDQSPQRMGNAHPNVVPYQVFPTSDGHLIITAGNDRQFEQLCNALEKPELANDARYTSNNQRVANRDTLIESIMAVTPTRTTDQWIKILGEKQVPCGPINDMQSVFADPQVIDRGLKIELPGENGQVPGVASPLRLSDTPPAYHSAPPLLGQHTLEILKDHLKLDDNQCNELIEAGICATSPASTAAHQATPS